MINFGEDSDAEDSDDEADDDEAPKLVPTLVSIADEDQDEMSLTRANKVLEGSGIADLAMTKVRRPPQ